MLSRMPRPTLHTTGQEGTPRLRRILYRELSMSLAVLQLPRVKRASPSHLI